MSFKKGDDFENYVFKLIKKMVSNYGISFANPKNSRVFKQKGYYSNKRGAEIKIDVSIEVYHKGTDKIALLIPIECKSHKTKISVGLVEEYYSKVNQIADMNVKAMFFSATGYESGALTFGRNTKMALVRVIPENQIDFVTYHALPNQFEQILNKTYPQEEIRKAFKSTNYIAENWDVFFYDDNKFSLKYH